MNLNSLNQVVKYNKTKQLCRYENKVMKQNYENDMTYIYVLERGEMTDFRHECLFEFVLI